MLSKSHYVTKSNTTVNNTKVTKSNEQTCYNEEKSSNGENSTKNFQMEKFPKGENLTLFLFCAIKTFF